MTPPWENGPDRIEQLLANRNDARELLSFYSSLLVFQKSLFDLLAEADLTGLLANDLTALSKYFETFLDCVAVNGSTLLRSQAQEMTHWEREKQQSLLNSYWVDAEIPGGNFFPKAFLQPYAAFLAQHRITIQGRNHPPIQGCPLCGAPPQLAFLQTPPSTIGGGAGSEGASRYLLCSLCFTEWQINRILCPNCGESKPDKLPYYQSEQLPIVRVEACDSCKHYLKGIDLTKDGRAVPSVDELATPALDVWAYENGYEKIELNLVGI
jgi:FdhE protein